MHNNNSSYGRSYGHSVADDDRIMHNMDHLEDFDSQQGDVEAGSRGATLSSGSTRRTNNDFSTMSMYEESIQRGIRAARQGNTNRQQRQAHPAPPPSSAMSATGYMNHILNNTGGGGGGNRGGDDFSVNTGAIEDMLDDGETFDGSTIATRKTHRTPAGGPILEFPGRQYSQGGEYDEDVVKHATSYQTTSDTHKSSTSYDYDASGNRSSSREEKKSKAVCCGLGKCAILLILITTIVVLGAGAAVYLMVFYLPSQNSNQDSSSISNVPPPESSSSSTPSKSSLCCIGTFDKSLIGAQVCDPTIAAGSTSGCCVICMESTNLAPANKPDEVTPPDDASNNPDETEPAPVVVPQDTPNPTPSPTSQPPTTPPPTERGETSTPTFSPTTEAPTTAAPTTVAPTPAPTTEVPETEVPTTEAPAVVTEAPTFSVTPSTATNIDEADVQVTTATPSVAEATGPDPCCADSKWADYIGRIRCAQDECCEVCS